MEITLNSPHAADQLKARTALLDVIDPELLLNVVDLGLIYEVLFPAPGEIRVRMTLTTQFCPMGEAITTRVGEALRKTFPEREIHVELVWEPPWGPDRISEEGRLQLGF